MPKEKQAEGKSELQLQFMSDNGPLPFAFVNGYHFGDRLLEDVLFKITIVDGNKFKAEAKPEDMNYLEKLNLKKWLKEAESFAAGNDIFSDEHGEDCWIVDQHGNGNPHLKPRKCVPVQVQKTSIFDVLGLRPKK